MLTNYPDAATRLKKRLLILWKILFGFTVILSTYTNLVDMIYPVYK